MRRILEGLVVAGQIVVLAASAYQTAVTIWGLYRRPPARRARTGSLPRFAAIICARNERAAIGGLVADLLGQDYPADRLRVLVIAHNCTDDTAEVARAMGADVLEVRTASPGKGQALVAGIRHLGTEPDYVGVFDADSRVTPIFLRDVAAGIAGSACLQVETDPLPAAGWLGRGHGLGRRARNLFWWRPRETLGLGTTINGTGYFIRPDVAAGVVGNLRTLTEELEITARLYARGYAVDYLSSATVRLEEPDRLGATFGQRTRWARGHLGVLRHDWPGVVRRALRGDLRAFDMALHMVMPTRMITRTGVTLVMLASLCRSSVAVPRTLAAAGMAAEWVVPLAIALRYRLVPRNLTGLALAARHAVLSTLWLPIGAWSLLTTRRREWAATPRRGAGQGAATSAWRLRR